MPQRGCYSIILRSLPRDDSGVLALRSSDRRQIHVYVLIDSWKAKTDTR